MSLPFGLFARKSVHPRWRRFCPVRSVPVITAIQPIDLVDAGKKLVMLDADNTLLPWRGEEFAPETLAWIESCRIAGLELCLLSNTRNRERLMRLSETLKIPFAEGKFKPSPTMYGWALQKFNVDASQAVMIGDQLFTDVWGANRAQIEAILVKPIGQREFVGTKVNRFFEKFVSSQIVHALEAESYDDFPVVEPTGIFHSRLVRQIAKFCIVGGSSFVIDYCIRLSLYEKAMSGRELLSEKVGAQLREGVPMLFQFAHENREAFFPIAAFCGASVAIVNSFFWNRKWTFNITSKDDAFRQFRKFVIISVVGLILNVVLSGLFNAILPGDHRQSARIATFLAAGFVAVWNFLGQRLYAFRVAQ